MTKPRVREVVPADYPYLCELLAMAAPEQAELFSADRPELHMLLFGKLPRAGFHMCLVAPDSRDKPMAALLGFEPWDWVSVHPALAHSTTIQQVVVDNIFQLDTMATYPEHRGKGLATALLNRMERILRARKVRLIHTTISEENKPFYTKLGWEHDDELAFLTPGGAISHPPADGYLTAFKALTPEIGKQKTPLDPDRYLLTNVIPGTGSYEEVQAGVEAALARMQAMRQINRRIT